MTFDCQVDKLAFWGLMLLMAGNFFLGFIIGWWRGRFRVVKRPEHNLNYIIQSSGPRLGKTTAFRVGRRVRG